MYRMQSFDLNDMAVEQELPLTDIADQLRGLTALIIASHAMSQAISPSVKSSAASRSTASVESANRTSPSRMVWKG